MSRTKQLERLMGCIIYVPIKSWRLCHADGCAIYLHQRVGFQRCSFRQSGQSESLSIVERVTDKLYAFLYVYFSSLSPACRELTGTFDDCMKLNEQLETLYASRWKETCSALLGIADNGQAVVKPAYPFLLSTVRWENGMANENWYTEADMKVLVFGKETNTWVGDADDFGVPPSPVFSSKVSLGAVMGIYENFYATYYHHGGFSYNGTRYGTFHYGFNQFASLLNARCPDKKIAYLWNNIVKVGKADGSGFCGTEIYEAQKRCFMVVGGEVEILKPDLILFLTGDYDNRIIDCWNGAQFEALPSFTVNDVAQVKLPGISVPAYRTQHPSARVLKEERDKRLEAIINDFCK